VAGRSPVLLTVALELADSANHLLVVDCEAIHDDHPEDEGT